MANSSPSQGLDPDNGIRAVILGGPVPAPSPATPRSDRSTAITGVDLVLSLQLRAIRSRGDLDLDGDPRCLQPPDPPWPDPGLDLDLDLHLNLRLLAVHRLALSWGIHHNHPVGLVHHNHPVLTPDERHFVTHVLAFFAASDGIVLENLAGRFMTEVQVAEARAFYGFQISIEKIPSTQAKATIRSAKDSDPWIQRRAHSAFWATQGKDPMMSPPPPATATSPAVCAIFWLEKRGLMPGLISRDEGLHCDFSCLLYSLLNNKLAEERMKRMVKEAVDIEREFVVDDASAAAGHCSTELPSTQRESASPTASPRSRSRSTSADIFTNGSGQRGRLPPQDLPTISASLPPCQAKVQPTPSSTLPTGSERGRRTLDPTTVSGDGDLIPRPSNQAPPLEAQPPQMATFDPLLRHQRHRPRSPVVRLFLQPRGAPPQLHQSLHSISPPSYSARFPTTPRLAAALTTGRSASPSPTGQPPPADLPPKSVAIHGYQHRQLHCLVFRSGVDSDEFMGNALIPMYQRSGCAGDAKRVFDEKVERNLVSWNALVSGLTQDGNYGHEASSSKPNISKISSPVSDREKPPRAVPQPSRDRPARRLHRRDPLRPQSRLRAPLPPDQDHVRPRL